MAWRSNPVLVDISGFRGPSSTGGWPLSAFADVLEGVLEVPAGIEPVDYGRPDDREQPGRMRGANRKAPSPSPGNGDNFSNVVPPAGLEPARF